MVNRKTKTLPTILLTVSLCGSTLAGEARLAAGASAGAGSRTEVHAGPHATTLGTEARLAAEGGARLDTSDPAPARLDVAPDGEGSMTVDAGAATAGRLAGSAAARTEAATRAALESRIAARALEPIAVELEQELSGAIEAAIEQEIDDAIDAEVAGEVTGVLGSAIGG